MEETGPAGAEESWTAVELVASEAEAAIVVGFLESEGIPARVVDRSFTEVPVSSEDVTEIAVAVPTARLSDAVAALERREEAFASQKEGEETILTDEGHAEIDPRPEPEGNS